MRCSGRSSGGFCGTSGGGGRANDGIGIIHELEL